MAAALADNALIQGKITFCIDAELHGNTTFTMGDNSTAPGLYPVLTEQMQAVQRDTANTAGRHYIC